MIEVWELVKSGEATFKNHEGETILEFRIDVLRLTASERSRFKVRVWRFDLFRLTPTFGPATSPQNDAYDHTVSVSDYMLDNCEIEANGPDEAFNESVGRLCEKLNLDLPTR